MSATAPSISLTDTASSKGTSSRPMMAMRVATIAYQNTSRSDSLALFSPVSIFQRVSPSFSCSSMPFLVVVSWVSYFLLSHQLRGQ